MKRLFCLTFVVFVLVLAAPHTVMAVTNSVKTMPVKAAITVSPSPTPMPKRVEYELPYPGILPTHPLYFLKNLRDTIIESLITDPVNKSEFYTLQADKKINMALMLKSANKNENAKSAIAESIAAHDKSIALLSQQLKDGKQVPPHILEKLARSLLKHKEVLGDAGQDTKAVDAQITTVQGLMPAK